MPPDTDGSAETMDSGSTDQAFAETRLPDGGDPESGVPLPGNWTIFWEDEFDGVAGAAPDGSKWFPLLAYDPDNFKTKTEMPLRWSGATEASAWMYSTRSGNHWLDGKGHLVVRAAVDPADSNDHGPKAKMAYLVSGHPESYTAGGGVKWEGNFFTPADGPIYIEARINAEEHVSWGTSFAFWLFSETKAYDDDVSNGTEIDIVELPKGAPGYFSKSFNTAHHWNLTNTGSEGKFLTGGEALSFADVSGGWHTFGLEWTTTRMRCYADGKLYYTYSRNVPTRPDDMMLMLTMEFQPGLWAADTGDGRTAGPFVTDDPKGREMSRVLVDHVRAYRQK